MMEMRDMAKHAPRYARGGNRTGRHIGAAVLIVLILAVMAGVMVWYFNEFTLEITLTEPGHSVAEFEETYTDPGATGCFRGTLLRKEPLSVPVQTSGSVDTNRLGEQILTYEAEYVLDLWITQIPFRATAQRPVTVRDTKAPEITLTAHPETFTIPGQPYEEEGFVARDNYDGDITALVERAEKDGTVTYTVSDSSGNQATVTRAIFYHDPIAPTITLNGNETLVVMKGSTYEDPGFTAQDNCDGDITNRVTVTGQVDTGKVGTYELTYTVTDSYGNEATAKRSVRVWMTGSAVSSISNLPDYIPGTYVEPNGKTIYLTFDDGPSPYTQRLLDILEAYGVKATFFVVSNKNSHMIGKIAAAGHTVAMHSTTHNYAQIYSSDEAYYNDLHTIESIIIRETGSAPKLFRFPGGTSNTVSRSYCVGIMSRVSQELRSQGYRYYDWHVDSGDAMGANTVKAVYDNVVNAIAARKNSSYTVVLQHDTNEASVNAVEAILIWGLANGYTFEALNESSPGCTARPAN